MIWDQIRCYETGLDRGVFYPPSGPGEAWNGLTSVKEDPSDSDEQVRYLDGVRTNRRRRLGYFSGTIEAYTYPESFYDDILIQRRPPSFGFSYRVMNSESYKIHLVYNTKISPATISHKQFEVDPFSWDFTSLPIQVLEERRSAHLIVDAAKAYSSTMEDLEAVLYGSDTDIPHLPLPEELLAIFESNAILRITDNGDGTWTATGPDEAIVMLDATTFEIAWPSAIYIDTVSYTISSL